MKHSADKMSVEGLVATQMRKCILLPHSILDDQLEHFFVVGNLETIRD